MSAENYMNNIEQYMERTFEQWEKCDPRSMATMQSDVAIENAFKDAKHDILFLRGKLSQLAKTVEHIS